MKIYVLILGMCLQLNSCNLFKFTSYNFHKREVIQTQGLIAFWDFSKVNQSGNWTSSYDDQVHAKSYDIFIRQIGDSARYTLHNWPYNDRAKSKVVFDKTGPFGNAVRFNQGYIFGEVPREQFDTEALDINGRRSFTMIAWCKFIGKRHFVSGIWDEGGWDKYGGRRQYALFGGLFQSDGVIGHISTTGAASYPQSLVPGSQYARARAIDGGAFSNDEWVQMAVTYDATSKELLAYQDGIASPAYYTDAVEKDVYQYDSLVSSNPYIFDWPVYSPRAFTLKYNGYGVDNSGVYEHWISVDIDQKSLKYNRIEKPGYSETEYFIEFDIIRTNESLLETPLSFRAVHDSTMFWNSETDVQKGDEIYTSLLKKDESGQFERIGTSIRYTIRDGAPFTFGRALGLGEEPVEEGTQLFIDGVAVFNRVLSGQEIKNLNFN